MKKKQKQKRTTRAQIQEQIEQLRTTIQNKRYDLSRLERRTWQLENDLMELGFRGGA